MAGPLSNRRHELFAVALAGGATEQAAYEKAGYEGDRGNAARLTANDSIRARVAELQGQVADKATVDVATVCEKLTAIILAPPSEASETNPLCEVRMSKAGPYYAFPDKLGAIKELAKLMGWYREDQTREKEVDALAALLQSIAKR